MYLQYVATRFILPILCLLGCHKTFEAKVHQPNPYREPTGEVLLISEKLVIVTGDMELEVPAGPGAQSMTRLPLINTAYFLIVSHDRLRFRVQVEHKFEEYTDVATWDIRLLVNGKVYLPESVEPRKPKHKTRMWDYEQRSYTKNRYGDITHVNDDGWKRRVPLASVDFFRAWGDLVFYSRDIFTKRTGSVILEMTRGGITYKYYWYFDD